MANEIADDNKPVPASVSASAFSTGRFANSQRLAAEEICDYTDFLWILRHERSRLWPI